MLKKYRWIWIMGPMAVMFLGFCSSKQKKGEELLPKIILQTLASAHYQPVEIDDSFSSKVFDLFLRRLDRNKRFFLQSDYEEFEPYRYLLDDQAKSGSYAFFDLVSQTYIQRVEEIDQLFEELLQEPFSFDAVEFYEYDEDTRQYPESREALKEDWRQYLKWNVLEKYYAKVKSQERRFESGSTQEGDTDTEPVIEDPEAEDEEDTLGPTDTPLPLDSLKAQAQADVLKTQRNWFKRLKKFDREKQLDFYINCMTEVFDPHTNYYPPKEKEDFDIRMSGRLEGIGAQLSERDGEIKVEMVVPGSPSYFQGELKEGDIILKVAQKDSLPVSVVNMDLSDAVQLIRGKKGTQVILTVRKPDGTIVDIPIVRDVVVMEEGYAKSAILTHKDKKIGFIYLPQFYTDMNRRGGRTCSKDVKAEVEKLMEQEVDGIVLDLRNNGGGSLQDVVDMAGIFAGKAPVVQVMSRGRKPEILHSRERKALYEGPLVVMVNKYSASASEILAAALQDYNRALVLGTNEQTFGKGTVQRFLELDRFASAPGVSFGAIKVTIQKFYRVNGGTTQLKGVIPDVVLPDRYQSVEVGERTEDFPLRWNEIEPVNYSLSVQDQSKAIRKAAASARKRIKKDDIFNLIQTDSERIAQIRKRTVYPLNFNEYRAQQEVWEKQNTQFDSLLRAKLVKNEVHALPQDLEAIGSDSVKLKIKNDWLKNYEKDVFLREATQIILDL